MGVLTAAAVIFLAVVVARFESGRAREAAPVETKASSERFAIGDVDAIKGTRFNEIVIATEASIGGGSGGYSRGRERDERNIILLDKATGANRKLLADNSRHIAARYYLPALEGAEEPTPGGYLAAIEEAEGKAESGKTVAPTLAYHVLVVDAVGGKSQDVLIGDLRSGQQAFVLTGIDGLDRLWMQSPTRMGILMRQGRKLRYRAIDLTTLKIVAAQDVDIG